MLGAVLLSDGLFAGRCRAVALCFVLAGAAAFPLAGWADGAFGAAAFFGGTFAFAFGAAAEVGVTGVGAASAGAT